MRITNNMMNNNYLSALNGSLERQSKLQEQLTDGQIVHRPSDDPIRTIRDLRFKTNLAMNDQYTQNVADSQSWMDTTDSAMSDLSSIMIRVKELVVSADGTKPADALNAIGVEIDQLINQAVTIGNTKIGDRYIFSGQMDKTQPFERKTITDPTNPSATPMDVVVYSGDLNKISMQIKQGAINPTQDSINLNGAEVFGPLKTMYGQSTMSIFSQLIAIKQELQGTARSTPTVPGMAGTTSVSGTYTGTGHTYFDVRIDSTTGGTSSSTLGLNGASPTTASLLNVSFPTLPAGPFQLTLTNGGLATAPPLSFDPAVDTLDSFMTKINNAGVNANASYDPVTDKFTLKATSGTLGFAAGDVTALNFLTNDLHLPDPTAGQVQTASYSTDGGNNWSSATVTPGNPSTLLLTDGMTLSIGQNTGNQVGGAYSFHAPGGIDTAWMSQVGLANVDAAHKSMLKQQTQLGARMATYEMAKNMLEDNNTTIIDTIAKNMDIDFPGAVINQKTNENVYKAALSVGSKLMQLSLVDFLR